MEGAANAQGAYLNKIPYVVLRAISDKADDSATMAYQTFESEAARRCVNLLQEMVKRLNSKKCKKKKSTNGQAKTSETTRTGTKAVP